MSSALHRGARFPQLLFRRSGLTVVGRWRFITWSCMTHRPKATPVPQTRLGRLARIGFAAAEMAVGGAVEGLRGLARSGGAAPSAVFSARNAQRLAARLARLRGAAMKLGQIVSLQGEDVLPPEFAQALAVLRTEAAPMPVAQLHGVLGRELGKGWEARFADFPLEPIAAASIGQVHRARKHGGHELALKIQYPGVARSVDSDVDNLASVLGAVNFLPVKLDVAALAGEAKRQLKRETDYEAEAHGLERYRRYVADMPGVIVPRVDRGLTTRHILAMEWIEGESLEVL
ncbi:MAG TPA: AarF/UbiB family protein, partial [Casimicrobiaceae bacterium]|nr:AarF/UbiB family protein [Casimicrobiaceae bacterium]